MHALSRRQFLTTSAAAGTFLAAPPLLQPAHSWAAPAATDIRIDSRMIEVNGKAAKVFGLLQPDGTQGLYTNVTRPFRVRLENRVSEPALIHWHGLTPPFRQDGVPGITQPALPQGQAYDYDFPLSTPGTFWMHSHHSLQEQQLMAAPLIVRDSMEVRQDVQEVVVMLHDFTFRDPAEILAELSGGAMAQMHHGGSAAPAAHAGHGAPAAPASDHAAMGHGTTQSETSTPASGHAGHNSASGPHLHDVEYDAYLANDRTLADPEVVRVEPGGRVRLRIINAASATNFIIDLDHLAARLLAVDGLAVEPIEGNSFDLAMAQRLDLLLELPPGQGAYPVFARREGERQRTGIVLATAQAPIAKLDEMAESKAPPVGFALERRLIAKQPLIERPVDRHLRMTLGEAPNYTWLLNGMVFAGRAPLKVRQGERVEITFVNDTGMAHPMHLHGHHFQVVGFNGERFAGARRDTVFVPWRGQVTIAFDADNPGEWMLHCHLLYHMANGMMTSILYES